MSLNNKVILVTGASSGIGAATAIVLAREGANVVVTGRNEENLKTVAKNCGQVGKIAFVIKADITDDNEVAAIISKTIEKFGKLDILVNNAGIFKDASIMAKDAVAVFDEVMSTNMRSIVVLTNLAVPYLVKTKGNIVNVSSVAATAQKLRYSAYCASKAALNQFTRAIAQELGESGVRANIISPGPVETPIFERSNIDLSWDQLKSLTALNKVSEAEEIGELIAYIVSDKAKSVTGSEFVIDCGVLCMNS